MGEDKAPTRLASPLSNELPYSTGNDQPSKVPLLDDNFALPMLSQGDPFRYRQLRNAYTNVTITQEVSKLVGPPTNVKRIVNIYFKSVHVWMPILSRNKFLGDVDDLWNDPKADIALLVLCVFLITQLPDDLGPDAMRTSLYAKIKSIYALVEALGVNTVTLVQSGILISLYEIGHGLLPTAYISMGTHARTAMACEIREGALSSTIPTSLQAWRLQEEQRRVWWGIMVVDRYISLHSHGRTFAAIDPKLDDFLPIDDAAWDADVMSIPNDNH